MPRLTAAHGSHATSFTSVRSESESALENPVDGTAHRLLTRDAGMLTYYADTTLKGRPVVLIHGLHAAASAKDVAPLFDGLRRQRRVIAVDLPGFGRSERSDRPYTPDLYAKAIATVLRQVAPTGADVVALSLSSEITAMVARDHPSLIHSLCMISPTGFTRPRDQPRNERAARSGRPIKRGWLRTRAIDPVLFSLLATHSSLSMFLRKSFCGPVDEELLEYAYETSHQPGAHYAPSAFLAGQLFPSGNPLARYAQVRCPVLVVFDQDAYGTFEELPAFVAKHPQWRSARIFPTRGLPHFEAKARTLEVLDAHWRACPVADQMEDSGPASDRTRR